MIKTRDVKRWCIRITDMRRVCGTVVYAEGSVRSVTGVDLGGKSVECENVI